MPVVGDLDDVAALALQRRLRGRRRRPDARLDAEAAAQLAWDLEGAGVELVVDPGLMEITGPRLHVAPVDGLPLLRLTEPPSPARPKLLKGAFDRPPRCCCSC